MKKCINHFKMTPILKECCFCSTGDRSPQALKYSNAEEFPVEQSCFIWSMLAFSFAVHCSAVCLEKLGSVKNCHNFHLIVPPCLVYTLPGTANVCLSWVMLPAWRPPVMPLWSRWSGFKITAITVRSEWCFKSENPNLHQTCLVDGAVSLLASGVDHLYIPHALLLTLWNRLIFHPDVTLWWWWILR